MACASVRAHFTVSHFPASFPRDAADRGLAPASRRSHASMTRSRRRASPTYPPRPTPPRPLRSRASTLTVCVRGALLSVRGEDHHRLGPRRRPRVREGDPSRRASRAPARRAAAACAYPTSIATMCRPTTRRSTSTYSRARRTTATTTTRARHAEQDDDGRSQARRRLRRALRARRRRRLQRRPASPPRRGAAQP